MEVRRRRKEEEETERMMHPSVEEGPEERGWTVRTVSSAHAAFHATLVWASWLLSFFFLPQRCTTAQHSHSVRQFGVRKRHTVLFCRPGLLCGGSRAPFQLHCSPTLKSLPFSIPFFCFWRNSFQPHSASVQPLRTSRDPLRRAILSYHLC